MAFRTPARLWEPRLSISTISPGDKVRYEHLLDIGKEPRAIDGTVEDTRSSHAVIAQRGQKSRRLPVTERRVGDEPLASFTSPVAGRHVGRGPGLVDKNKPLRVKAFLHLAPGGAGVLDIRAFLLGGMQSFFKRQLQMQQKSRAGRA